MSKPALLHDIRPGEPGWADRLIAFHRLTFGDSVMEEPDAAAKAAADKAAADKAEADNAAADAAAKDKGFPENTPIAEMTAEQQAAYWKHQARKHEQRAESRSDYDDLKAKAEQFDKAQRDAETEHEKAIREAREAAKAEGRAEALAESTETTVKALLEGALKVRGEQDPASVLKFVTSAAFVTDGQIDHDAITAFADRTAGSPAGGKRNPDMGQGNRGNGATAGKGVSAGADMFAASRGKKTT